MTPTLQSQAAQTRADQQVVETPRRWVGFDLRTMRIGSVPDFDLYIHHDGEYVLYRHRDLKFDQATADNLQANGVDTLYVSEAMEIRLAGYCEHHLDGLLRDEAVPLEERADTVVRVAQNLGRDIVVDGHTQAAERSVRLATALTDFVAEEPESMSRLVNAVRDGSSLQMHSANTAVYAVALARHAPVPSLELVANLSMAGLLHDVGLTFTPPKILEKTSRLSVSERKQVELHPSTAEMLLMQSGGVPDEVVRAVRCHHERLDGSGYPDGLRGFAIPWMARALAIAEVFDSLTSTQPWRPRMSPYDALQLMLSELRAGLDVDLIKALIPALRATDDPQE